MQCATYATLLPVAKQILKGDVLGDFNGQCVSNVAWAYAKLEMLNQPLMDALADRTQYLVGNLNFLCGSANMPTFSA